MIGPKPHSLLHTKTGKQQRQAFESAMLPLSLCPALALLKSAELL